MVLFKYFFQILLAGSVIKPHDDRREILYFTAAVIYSRNLSKYRFRGGLLKMARKTYLLLMP